MANIKHLEKDYTEILLGLTAKEVAEYYRQLNKKIVNCYPTLNSNWNEEELNSLLASVEDVTNVLKRNYTKDSLDKTNLSSRYAELDSKYITEIDLAFTKLNHANLLNITVNILSSFGNMAFFLSSLYNNYVYLNNIKTIYEDVDLEKGTYVYVEVINDFIENEFNKIRRYISIFEEDYSEINVDNLEELPESVTNAITDYNKLYSKCSSYVNDFEDFIANPFEDAIKIAVEVDIEHYSKYTEEDYSALLESKTTSAPKYNFETFEIILPEVEPVEGVVK